MKTTTWPRWRFSTARFAKPSCPHLPPQCARMSCLRLTWAALRWVSPCAARAQVCPASLWIPFWFPEEVWHAAANSFPGQSSGHDGGAETPVPTLPKGIYGTKHSPNILLMPSIRKRPNQRLFCCRVETLLSKGTVEDFRWSNWMDLQKIWTSTENGPIIHLQEWLKSDSFPFLFGTTQMFKHCICVILYI